MADQNDLSAILRANVERLLARSGRRLTDVARAAHAAFPERNTEGWRRALTRMMAGGWPPEQVLCGLARVFGVEAHVLLTPGGIAEFEPHDYEPTDLLHMTAGYGSHTVAADPVTLAEVGLDAGELARLGKDEVEARLVEVCNKFVWETVGDSCGWYVRSQDGEVR